MSESMTAYDNEADAIEMLHETSMSDHPGQAATGRMGKILLPALMKALQEEADRGTAPADVLIAIQMATVSLYVSAYATVYASFDKKIDTETAEAAVKLWSKDALEGLKTI